MIKNYIADGAIAHRRLVRFSSADGRVVQAAAATDAIIGVADCPGGAVAGERVDVVRSGLAEVEFGGAVTRGGLVTADAAGKAVAVAPAAGANVRTIGVAEETSASGDLAPVLILAGSHQG